MSVDFAWHLSEPDLALADVRVALADVAARHPGVVVRREFGSGETNEDPGDDTDAWLEGEESFMVGFPAAMVKENGDTPEQPPDEKGLYWGEILFALGDDDEGEGDDEAASASMQISSTLSGGDRLWTTLSGFADEVAAELGARSEEDLDEESGPGAEQPLTWSQIRQWIRREELEISEEDAEHMSVVLRWEHDGRSQKVTLARETRLDLPWLRLSSFFCKEAELAPEEALLQNETLLASIARSEDDGLLYLVQRVPFSALTLPFFDTLLWDLGAEADLLENEITEGRDEH